MKLYMLIKDIESPEITANMGLTMTNDEWIKFLQIWWADANNRYCDEHPDFFMAVPDDIDYGIKKYNGLDMMKFAVVIARQSGKPIYFHEAKSILHYYTEFKSAGSERKSCGSGAERSSVPEPDCSDC